MDGDLQTLDPVTGAAPTRRILNAASLNAIVKSIVTADETSARARLDVQQMLDGAPPYNEDQIRQSGQEGRCNLNFGDGKARVKSEQAGYYDLTDSVPVLARIFTKYGDEADWSYNSNVISEEFHRMLKSWKAFDSTYQLLVQKFCSHGLGFLYFKDDYCWQWSVAGLDDFKLPRNVNLVEDDLDMACVMREITVGKLYAWYLAAPEEDKRWNKKEVEKAILNAHDPNQKGAVGAWEAWQTMAKNNDMFMSASAKTVVSLAHCWVREFSGKVSYYLTLRDGSNTDYLFKCEDRYASIDQCFTYFPYEIGSNGTLHSVRGLGHEVYAAVQVLNTLRCQTVDNAKLSGSLLLQPKDETSAEDLAILYYGGATYIPPNVTVANGQLNNPSQGILPVIQDMRLTLRQNTGDMLTKQSDTSSDKTKFEVASELMKEAVLPTSNLNLFYQPWGRHLSEVWRRVRRKGWKVTDEGGQAVLDFMKRCEDRNVPAEAIYAADQIQPMRAVGYGSPANRLLAFDEFMQFFGSLDPVGQNNLLRDRFAQRVGYAQVDDYVPRLDKGGRAPADQEIAELQNFAMSQGRQVTVRPNDNHIIHLQAHLPDIQNDLDALESGQNTPTLLAGAQIKAAHSAEHIKILKPDKLQEKIVAELNRQFNNVSERVKAATEFAERHQAQQQQAQSQQPPQPSDKEVQMAKDAETRRQIAIQDAAQKRDLREADATQKRAIRDAAAAAKLHEQIGTYNLPPAPPAAVTGPTAVPPAIPAPPA